jgi:hypothetical protein
MLRNLPPPGHTNVCTKKELRESAARRRAALAQGDVRGTCIRVAAAGGGPGPLADTTAGAELPAAIHVQIRCYGPDDRRSGRGRRVDVDGRQHGVVR